MFFSSVLRFSSQGTSVAEFQGEHFSWVCRHPLSCCVLIRPKEGERTSGFSAVGTNPRTGAPSPGLLSPNYFIKAPAFNSISLEVRASKQKFEGQGGQHLATVWKGGKERKDSYGSWKFGAQRKSKGFPME